MKWPLAVQVVIKKEIYILISFTSHTVGKIQPSQSFEEVSLHLYSDDPLACMSATNKPTLSLNTFIF